MGEERQTSGTERRIRMMKSRYLQSVHDAIFFMHCCVFICFDLPKCMHFLYVAGECLVDQDSLLRVSVPNILLCMLDHNVENFSR